MIDVLSLLLEILAVVLCIHYLYGEKLKLDILTVGFIVIEMSYLLGVNQFAADNRWTLLMYPMVMLYCGIKFGANIKKILVNNILYMLIISCVQASIAVLLRIVTNFFDMHIELPLLCNFFTLVVMLLLFRKEVLKKLSDIMQIKENIIIVSLLVAILCTILFLISYKSSNGFDSFYYLILVICIFLIGIAALDIGKHKMKAREAEAELRLHRLYEHSFKNLIEDICAKQHEFDNHINVLYNQRILYDNYEGLIKAQEEYCKEIIKENKYNKLLSKGNPIILGFLYGKFLEAEKVGIEVEYKVRIGSMDGTIPIYKIVELLGNLYKNSVEEVERNGYKNIRVSVIEDDEKVKIEVSNRVENINYDEISEFFKRGYSKKGEKRGYGLYNVKKICSEYGAEIECKDFCENNVEKWLKFSVELNKSL